MEVFNSDMPVKCKKNLQDTHEIWRRRGGSGYPFSSKLYFKFSPTPPLTKCGEGWGRGSEHSFTSKLNYELLCRLRPLPSFFFFFFFFILFHYCYYYYYFFFFAAKCYPILQFLGRATSTTPSHKLCTFLVLCILGLARY